MSNQLKMAQVQSILALSVRGWSQRRIARELGVDRETVARHIGLAAANPAKVPTGSDGSGVVGEASNPVQVPTGSDEGLLAFSAELLPTKPYTPRHKGKIERGIGYVKGNALKARTFGSLEEQNRFLGDWEVSIADTRIHGTTKRQVGKVFVEIEKSALLPLPCERFAMFLEAQRIVSRDGHVEVAKAYYSVPPEYLGLTVWARWDTRLVRVFNQRFEQIAMHAQHEQGRFSTQAKHIAPEKISGLERGASRLLADVSVIGPHTSKWSEAMLTARGIEGTRVLLGLRALTKKHACDLLERACEIALSHGEFRLRIVRKLLDRQAAQQLPLPLLEEHPLIRPLSDYGRVVRDAWQRGGARADQRRADPSDERRAHSSAQASSERGFLRHHEDVPSTPQQHSPGRANDQGCIDPNCTATSGTRPRPEYPLSGCASAEPNSVSPGGVSVDAAAVPVPFSQECSHE